jgi:hypothetical protein
MRFQVDEHRERLKEKIDNIALAMIDDIKKNEESFLKSLRKCLFETQSFDEAKSHEDKLNEIEEMFRNPNLLIQTIQLMQRKQEESLNEIQSKLNQMNHVYNNLKATNEFKPNLSSFNQEDLFGSLKVIDLCSNTNSLMSQILKGELQLSEMINLCEFSPDDKWSLLYRATRDGFEVRDFHSKCDGHSNTLTILKAKQSGFIFGGYTTVHWESKSQSIYKSDPNAFIFSLTNKDNTPLKMKVAPNKHQYAIGCYCGYGPWFTGGIHIGYNANTNMGSNFCYSNLGYVYSHPQYVYCTDEAKSFLTGSQTFQLDEIEVYQREQN